MTTWQIVMFDTPPSLNRVGSRGSHWEFHRAKKQWEHDLWILILEACRPRARCKRIQASAVLTFPKRRPRDEDNFRPLLSKALGDACRHAKLIPDDTPEHFVFAELRFDLDPGPKRTTITLTAELESVR